MTQIVVMPGGFHPFHAGHMALYNSARRAFPDAEVYVAATNDTSSRPFPFAVKEKLAKLAGVEPGKFIQVKSPFRANEVTDHYDPEQDTLIFVRSQKDTGSPPQPGGTKKDGSPAYLQPLKGVKNLAPFNRHAYMAYLPTVEFGPGMTSATQIRSAWPSLNNKRKTALVMSLYPRTQTNPKLAAVVVKLLDAAIGTQEVAESQTAKTGIMQTDVYGSRAYHARCLEPGCDWESRRYDRIQQAQAAAKKHGEQHFDKKAVAEGVENDDTAISLSRLGRFHKGQDTLAEFVPERATARYALHPDKWESTFFSLTNKDPRKLKYFGPKKIVIPPGTLVGDMAIANRFYRAETEEEKQKYAEEYRQSLKPYPVDISQYRMPELLISREGVAESFSNDMSTEDMIEYIRQHHDKNLHPDYLNHITTTNSKFVLKNIPLTSIRTDLSGLDPAKVEQYKQMDFSKAPPIVVGSDGNILDGYHRANVAKALNIPTIRAYVGVKGQQSMAEGSWTKPRFDAETVVYDGPKAKGISIFSAGYHPNVNTAWIEAIKSVEPGAGAAMLKSFEQWAKSQGAHKINAEALATSLNFWKKMGYAVAGDPSSKNRVPIQKHIDIEENQGWAATYTSETSTQNFVGGMRAGYQARENQPVDEDYIDEKWSQKYKRSINCANPRGFSQRAHCAGRKK